MATEGTDGERLWGSRTVGIVVNLEYLQVRIKRLASCVTKKPSVDSADSVAFGLRTCRAGGVAETNTSFSPLQPDRWLHLWMTRGPVICVAAISSHADYDDG